VELAADANRDDAVGDGGADGGVAVACHKLVEHLGDVGFAFAEGVDFGGENGVSGDVGQVRQDVQFPQGLHFAWHTGHDPHGCAGDSGEDSGGGAGGVGQH